MSGLAAISMMKVRKAVRPFDGRQPDDDAGRRLPLEQAPLRDDQTDEREDDGVPHLPRVVRQQHQRQDGLRERGLEILAEAAEQHREWLPQPRKRGQSREGQQDRRAEHHQRQRRPEPRTARKGGPADDEQTEERGGEQAPSKIVEDLPAADQRQMVALDSAASPAPMGTATRGSASRRAPIGAVDGRGPAPSRENRPPLPGR